MERLRPLVGADETMSQMALRFVISHPAVSTVIPGARNRRQAEQNCGAARLGVLDAQTRAAIDAVVAPCGGRKIWPA